MSMGKKIHMPHPQKFGAYAVCGKSTRRYSSDPLDCSYDWKKVTCKRCLKQSVSLPDAGEPVADLDAAFWKQIKDAARNSPWMPKEYCMNDWVSDVCRFLLKPEERQATRPFRFHERAGVGRFCRRYA